MKQKKKIIGTWIFFLSLVMVIANMPMAKMAAKAATGIGTQTDPYIATTYEELMDALTLEAEEMTYVKVPKFSTLDDSAFYGQDAQIKICGKKTLILEGAVFGSAYRENPTDAMLYVSGEDTFLELQGNGELRFTGDGNLSSGNAVVRVDQSAKVNISGDILFYGGANASAIENEGGSISINGARLQGGSIAKSPCGGAVFANHGTMQIHNAVLESEGFGTVSGTDKAVATLYVSEDATVELQNCIVYVPKKVEGGHGIYTEKTVAECMSRGQIAHDWLDRSLLDMSGKTLDKDTYIYGVIDVVYLTVEAPYGGKMPGELSYSATDMDNSSVTWYSGLNAETGIRDNTAFVTGSDYSAVYKLQAKSGWFLDDSILVDVTGGEKAGVKRIDDITVEITVNFPNIKGEIENNIISRVDLTVEKPIPNTPISTPEVSTTTPNVYVKVDKSWYDANGTLCTGDFVEGNVYYTDIYLRAPRGEFDMKSLFDIVKPEEGMVMSVRRTNDNKFFYVTIAMVAEGDTYNSYIDRVSVTNYVEPKVGEESSFCTVPSASNYKVSQQWFVVSGSGSSMSGNPFSGVFEEGKLYCLILSFTPNRPFKFSKQAKIYVDGVSYVDEKMTEQSITLYLYTDLTHKHEGVKVEKIEATCTADGVKEYYECACGQYFTDAECTDEIEDLEAWRCGDGKISKKEHSLTVVLTKATTSADGKRQTKCTVCGTVTDSAVIYAAQTVKLSKTTYVYDGKAKKPTVVIKDRKGKTIDAKNYTVNYPTGCKNVGKYTVKITFKNDYKGSKNLNFVINPTKTSIKSLTPMSKSFVVAWTKKTTQVDGYEIQYSTSSTFATGNKTVKVTSPKTVTKTVKSLKAKKKYYVRIRTYKTVGSTKFYSDWSEKKTVTTKK